MFSKSRKPTQEDLCQFFRILRLYHIAGISTVRSLEYFSENNCENARMKEIVGALQKDLLNGLNFSDALKKQPFFPAFIIALIHVGEETGDLARLYDEIVFHLEQRMEVQGEVKSNMFTVKLFLALAVVAVILAIFVVLPKMHEILMDLNADLPLMTRFLLEFGNVMASGWPVFLLLAIGGFGGVKYLMKAYPEQADRAKLKIPFYSSLYYLELQYRMAKVLSLVAHSNIPITESIRYAAISVDHIPLKNTLLRAAKEIQNAGTRTADALKKADLERLIDDNLYVMVSAGEISGEISRTMGEIGEDYRKNLLRESKNIGTKVGMSIIVPVMAFLMFLLFAVFQPISTIMGAAAF